MNKLNLKIGKFEFTGVKELQITQSIRSVESTCTIELPLQTVTENKLRHTLEKEIKRGNTVTVIINETAEFAGFVKATEAGTVLKIECENNAYLLRTACENKIFAKTTLNEILKHIIKNTGIELNNNVPQIDLLSFSIKDISRLSALQKLKEEYGLTVFFDTEGKLYAGLESVYNSGKVKYHLQKNVIEADLKFTSHEDSRYKVEAKSRLQNNKLITTSFGDADGDLRTFITYGIETEAELKVWAANELAKIKQTGIEGSLTTFGLPIVQIGMTAQIADNIYPLRNGAYLVESVKTSFGQSGYKRTIELGKKLDA